MTGKRCGFSLLEMLVVVALLGVIAQGAVPVAELTFIRNQEEILQESLDQIRQAIDNYKRDAISSVIRQTSSYDALWAHESLFYPPDMTALFKPDPSGYEIKWKDRAGNDLVVTFYPSRYLDSIPVDPFVGSANWTVHFASGTSVVIYDSGTHGIPPDHVGIFDVSVNSDPSARKGFITAIDGTRYEDW